MPKQRPPFARQRYASLKAQGLSQRAIAQAMGMPEATLRNNLKVMAQAVAHSAGEELPRGHQDLPARGNTEVHLGVPNGGPLGSPEEADEIPPLYVHLGIPDDGEESPVGGEDIAEVHQGIPALPLTGIQEGDQGPPMVGLSPQLADALTTAWPELQHLLAWWQARQQQLQAPVVKLVRVTYHVAPQWIEAVRREADMTGESYATVVNRAFATYFRAKST